MFIDPALSVTKNYEKLIKITTKISFSQVQVKYEWNGISVYYLPIFPSPTDRYGNWVINCLQTAL